MPRFAARVQPGRLWLGQFLLPRHRVIRVVVQRVEVHQALHQRAERQHHHGNADRPPADGGIDGERAFLGHFAAFAAGRLTDLARDEIADRGHVEPRAHDERGEELGREPVHCGEADGREAELGGSREQIVGEDTNLNYLSSKSAILKTVSSFARFILLCSVLRKPLCSGLGQLS